MGFITNQPQIVESARNAYRDNPTIVNNIPKDGKRYTNTMDNFAMIDNNLAQAQEAIGNSSNIAQIAQTYMYSFPNEQKYVDYVCILAVIAQCAIDNAKRTFDIDINAEIGRIEKDMDIKENGYPIFWKSIQDRKRAKSGSKAFSSDKINRSLICPMNFLNGLEIPKFRNPSSTLPIDYFFNPQPLDNNRRTNKKVEELISTYAAEITTTLQGVNSVDDSEYILAEINYDNLINELNKIHLSNGYIGLMSWLIDRAFLITPNMKKNRNSITRTTNKNKGFLLKVLFDINPKCVIKLFSRNIKND